MVGSPFRIGRSVCVWFLFGLFSPKALSTHQLANWILIVKPLSQAPRVFSQAPLFEAESFVGLAAAREHQCCLPEDGYERNAFCTIVMKENGTFSAGQNALHHGWGKVVWAIHFGSSHLPLSWEDVSRGPLVGGRALEPCFLARTWPSRCRRFKSFLDISMSPRNCGRPLSGKLDLQETIFAGSIFASSHGKTIWCTLW